jgi:PAS domain S-box-containing protein
LLACCLTDLGPRKSHRNAQSRSTRCRGDDPRRASRAEPDLTIRFANRSFCQIFEVARDDTVGRKLHELGIGQWDIPELRTALETIISGRKTIEAFEVDQFFPSIGRRIMLLNARKIYRPGNKIQQILLAIEDVTERVRLEREHAIAHERIGMLMQELTHRVKNSLQSIAAMVFIEARDHKSGEGEAALERVSHRIDALGQLYSTRRSSAPSLEEPGNTEAYFDEGCSMTAKGRKLAATKSSPFS